MNHLLRRVVPKSIINILAMIPTPHRDELDIICGVRYGFTEIKKTQPPQKQKGA